MPVTCASIMPKKQWYLSPRYDDCTSSITGQSRAKSEHGGCTITAARSADVTSISITCSLTPASETVDAFCANRTGLHRNAERTKRVGILVFISVLTSTALYKLKRKKWQKWLTPRLTVHCHGAG